MLDRLGRKSFDTPGVVIELARYGVQVWSVNDGYVACETPEDEVNLFLKCWSAEGESRKTSIRTKARLSQLVEEGHIKGGLCPYGYRYVKDGRVNKRGKELLKYEIEEYEAEIVRLMYELFRTKAYGPQRIATYLYDEKGITDRSGKKFSTGTIRGILRNILYTGIIRCADTYSQIMPEIQIISPEEFSETQEQIEERSGKHRERSVPVTTGTPSLLSGNVFFGHCGSRMVLNSSVKGSRKPPSGKTVRHRYTCQGARKKRVDCDGQTGYTVRIIDEIITAIVKNVFCQFGEVPKQECIDQRIEQKKPHTPSSVVCSQRI